MEKYFNKNKRIVPITTWNLSPKQISLCLYIKPVVLKNSFATLFIMEGVTKKISHLSLIQFRVKFLVVY